jgi:predicted nucleic acid-binding protein
MAAVSNTSPLRYFVAIGRADLLPCVLGPITIPPTVLVELTQEATPGAVRKWIASPPEWLSVHSTHFNIDPGLASILDSGESAAIQLALDLQPDFILIDERLGRKEASRRGLVVIGALGVLREAHRLGVLADPIRALDDLCESGFRISKRLIQEFKLAIERV